MPKDESDTDLLKHFTNGMLSIWANEDEGSRSRNKQIGDRTIVKCSSVFDSSHAFFVVSFGVPR